MSNRHIASLLAAILLPLTATSRAGDLPQPYGVPAPVESAQREIKIGPMTRYVNVERAETVRFVTEKGSFAWSFDIDPNRQEFAFDQIAPAALQAHEVRVFVGRSAHDK